MTARYAQLHLALAAAAVFAAAYAATRADVTREPNLACLRAADAADDPAGVLVTCTDAVQRAQALVTLTVPGVLGLLTAVAAATAVPLLTTWWFGVRPVDADPHLDRLAAVAGVRTAWLTSTRRHRDSFTYHRGVVLHPALRRALRRRERVADAIVLHELGHVANRDVGRTYRAFVAPVLFLPLVAVPFAVVAAERTAAVEYTARFAVLLVVVGASWLAVLRAREHEADRRAREWDAEAFDAAVAAAPAPRGPWWLSTHPHHRGAAPAARFAGGAAAVVAAVAAVEATASVHHLLPTPLRHPALSAAVAAVVVGAALAKAARPASAGAVAVGLLVGAQLSPNAGPRFSSLYYAEAGPSWPVSLATAHPTALVVVLAATAGAGLAVAAAAARPFPRAVVVAGGPLAAWLVLLRTAAGDERRDALDVLALTWPTTAVAAGVALLAWAPRPAWVGVGVAVAALALVAPDLHRTPPPLPDTTQSGYLCTWLHAAGPTADAAVAARLARSDDPLLRRIAPALLTDPHADVAAARRCEFLLRYGRS